MIHFHQVSKYFAGKRAVDNLTLQIAKGEFTVLIGTSGSGKSTTLKMINRLIEHDEGEIHFAGEEIRNYKPEDIRRRMGYAIQSIGLFPHWTVERNIATVPQLLKWPTGPYSPTRHRTTRATASGTRTISPPLSSSIVWWAATACRCGSCLGG